MSRLKKIIRDKRGNFGLFAAILTVPVFAAAGVLVDYTQAVVSDFKHQNALDAAVLAGVAAGFDGALMATLLPEDTKKTQLDYAKSYFEQNFMNNSDKEISSVNFYFKNDILYGDSTIKNETTFMKLFGKEAIDVKNRAAATASAGRGPVCFMAMHPSRKHTLEMKGSVSIYAPDCNIYGNSNHVDDVVDPHSPDNYITAKSVQAIGYGHHYIENITPPLQHAPEVLADPLKTMPIPLAPSACINDGSKMEGSKNFQGGGTFCNGLSVENGNIHLKDGIYHIKNGHFIMNKSKLFGDNITIVLHEGVSIQWFESQIDISGSRNGQTQSVAIMNTRKPVSANRAVSTGRKCEGNDNSGSHYIEASIPDIEGVLYLPEAKIHWCNEGDSKINSNWVSWIVDGVTWTGSGTIYYNFDPSKSKLPLLNKLNIIPLGTVSTVRLVE